MCWWLGCLRALVLFRHLFAFPLISRRSPPHRRSCLLPFDTGGRLKLSTATFWRPSGRNLNRASTKGRDEDEWGVTPDGGFDLKLNVKELSDLQEHQREQEIIRGAGVKAPDTGFRDRQLDMALEYLRGQIRTASKNGAAKKAS